VQGHPEWAGKRPLNEAEGLMCRWPPPPGLSEILCVEPVH